MAQKEPTNGVYHGSVTVVVHGVLLRPGERLPALPT
jgi:hypothetical protein